MSQATTATTAIAAGLILLALPRVGEAQKRRATTPDSANLVTITPGPQYEAGGFARAFLGSGWRELWTTPVQAPVLDLSSYAGGLKLKERGGGFQSIVLHLDEENGWREYRFRSVDKFPMQGMPEALHGTTVGRFFEDQVSGLFPAAPLLVHPLLESIGVLNVDADLYVMGDSPRLENQRDSVAGMLGTFELKGEEGPDDKPGFGGSRAIKNTEKFFADLASGQGHRLDEREFLAARLIDFLINDSDRTTDNFDWARFGEKGAYTWRPLPRDRDQAFMDARGLVNRFVVRRFYPKIIGFKPKFPLKGLTHTSHELDRRLLQRLTAEDFRDVALRVQRAVDNTVIARVVAELPATWRNQTSAGERLTSVLRARRDRLPEVAMAFYRDLAGEVDVHGTDEADRFDVLRHTDGRVTVTVIDPEERLITVATSDGSTTFNRIVTSDGSVDRPGERGPYYARTFLPAETNEIRLYTNGGDDVGTVRGAQSSAIKVRVIGGKGDDVLADSAGGGGTVLYDADGKNVLVTGNDTRVSTRPWKAVKPRSGFRLGDPWRPDWGRSAGWVPAVTYKEGAGLVLGAGPRFTSYGFRRLPHHWRAQATPMIGTGNGRLGLTVDADYRAENSPRLFRLSGRATQLEATRFYGYGNDTPSAGSDVSRVDQTVFAVEPSLVWQIGWRAREWGGNPIRGDVDTTHKGGLRPLVGELRVGPAIGWIEPDPSAASRLSTAGVAGAQAFGFAAARLGLELDRTDRDPVRTSGWRTHANLAAYPSVFGLDNAFASASAGGSVYVPLVSDGPHLAFRAGGSLASSGYPVQFAPAVGGNSTVRGYPWHRFAGDAALSGGAELRVPVGSVNFLVRSQLGLFALTDVGRVWFDGANDGGWHTGFGGGFWLSALGRAVSVAYAHGESHRFYLKSGLSY
jgi:surface antigen Omp85-like protein